MKNLLLLAGCITFYLLGSATAAANAAQVELPGLNTVDANTWDETAVRKVLLTFAYGGQTTDKQIKIWADMDPRDAITEIMRWDHHNTKLSVPSYKDSDNLVNIPDNLAILADYWGRSDYWNQMPGERRNMFSVWSWERPRAAWTQAAVSRGLNPFRERIGFWETNYHMAVTMKGGPVNVAQAIRYYDQIMQAHTENRPYQDVIATAAISPAVARQYGHAMNVYWGGECHCNEDFGREFHQLFFGVLGLYNKTYHEQTNIKNTARMLTHMKTVNPTNPGMDWAGDQIEYGLTHHYPLPLEIHQQSFPVASADAQLRQLAQIEIGLKESLDNLPIMIVRGLADDSIDSTEAQGLRTAWRSMPKKNLLRFLRAYAISTLFHSAKRFKYQTSFDRQIALANLSSQTNEEQYLDAPELGRLYWEDQEVAFSPDWGVFGGQAGQDAADSNNLFRVNYNSIVKDYRYTRAERTIYGRTQRLDWGNMIPRDKPGTYSVATTAAWLWQRFIADGLKNFGPLERAHLYALLATGQDLTTIARPRNPEQPLSLADVQSPAITSLVNSLGAKTLALDSNKKNERNNANERVGQALSFIAATPYIFAQEGR